VAAGGGVGSDRVAPRTVVSVSATVANGLTRLGVDLCGIANLAGAAGNTVLRELWLGNNNVDSRATFALVAAMAVHPALAVIELRSNPLGPAAVRRLLRAFRAAHPRFARLGLAGTDLVVKKISKKGTRLGLGLGSGSGPTYPIAAGTDHVCGWEHFDEVRNQTLHASGQWSLESAVQPRVNGARCAAEAWGCQGAGKLILRVLRHVLVSQALLTLYLRSRALSHAM